MIKIKSDREIELIRQSGKITASVLEILGEMIRPGITTAELDMKAEDYIKESGGRPAFKGYNGFPASICTSINEEIVHGIPSKRTLKKGDIISVDVGVELEGYFSDAARTYAVGAIDEKSADLMDATKLALDRGVDQARQGKRVLDISRAVQRTAEEKGYSIIRTFVGHGVGSELHEAPEVPNFETPGKNIDLECGMVLAIEPMISAGREEVFIKEDGWTAVTKDGSRVAHFENTVAITENGPEVLTL